MGKRRSDVEHKSRYEIEDDDDDDIIEEETYEAEPLKPEQIANIQSRKKLIAKRRVNDSTLSTTASTISPFSGLSSGAKPFSLTTNTTSSETTSSSVFSGFKGFTGFNPLQTNTTTPAVSASSFFSSSSSSSLTNSASDQAKKTETTIETPKSLLMNCDSSKTNKTEETNADKTANKNIDDAELVFLNELNDLYQRCYSSNKRTYKLPNDIVNGKKDLGAEDKSSDSDDLKYAYLLSELNKNCSNWITKHVEQSPLVILTPVFIDYFNYLILLEKQFFPQTFNEKFKLNKLSSAMNGTPNGVAKVNGTTEADAKKTHLNGHPEEKANGGLDEKKLDDSSKSFASLINKTQTQPLNQIQLNTTAPPTTTTFGSSNSSLFFFNKIQEKN